MARADLFLGAYEWFARRAIIGPDTRRGRRFGSFGRGSIIAFPPVALYNEHAIHIGCDTLIGPGISLSAGMAPGQQLISDRIVTIGDRCLIGRRSSIVGHFDIVIDDDVFFGPNVYVTDQNHAVDDLTIPIGKQSAPELPVRIGAGSWIGTNAVILPGVTIGAGVAVGAGAVVTSDLPDNTIAVGSPARVIRDR
jgi:acetyltransferase-like isoleucine patch superfamily enzyme